MRAEVEESVVRMIGLQHARTYAQMLKVQVDVRNGYEVRKGCINTVSRRRTSKSNVKHKFADTASRACTASCQAREVEDAQQRAM